MTIAELFARHRRIGLDANVLVYLLEAIEPRAHVARRLLRAVEEGGAVGILSAIGLAEVLVGPTRHGDLALTERYSDEIRGMPGLAVVPLDPQVAADAAVIRGVRAIGLADAIHLASARAAGATAFVTNDRTLRGSPKLEIVYLDELEIGPAAA